MPATTPSSASDASEEHDAASPSIESVTRLATIVVVPCARWVRRRSPPPRGRRRRTTPRPRRARARRRSPAPPAPARSTGGARRRAGTDGEHPLAVDDDPAVHHDAGGQRQRPGGQHPRPEGQRVVRHSCPPPLATPHPRPRDPASRGSRAVGSRRGRSAHAAAAVAGWAP